MMPPNRYAFALVMTLNLAACLSTPDRMSQSQTDAPPEWSKDLEKIDNLDIAQRPIDQWWIRFEDPVLTDLISRAAADNIDLAVAHERIREARVLAAGETARSGPQIGASSSITGQRLSETGTLPVGDVPGFEAESILYSAGFDAAWEVDLFGRQGLREEIASVEVDRAEERQRDLLVSLAAEIARTYVELRAAQAEIVNLENNIARQIELANLTKTKRNFGEASNLDVERAELLIAQYEARLPAAHSRISVARNQLALLSGNAPSAFAIEDGSLPANPDNISMGLSSDLLRRRADIRQAERAYVAAARQADLSQLALYPKFQLVGSFGPETTDLSDILSPESIAATLSAILEWALFDNGRNQADIDAAVSRTAQAELAYRNAVLIALEEVETAAVRYGKAHETATKRTRITEAHRRLADIARVRYEAGTGNLLDVLASERDLADTELTLTQARADTLVHLTSLYKALGGGWQDFER